MDTFARIQDLCFLKCGHFSYDWMNRCIFMHKCVLGSGRQGLPAVHLREAAGDDVMEAGQGGGPRVIATNKRTRLFC